MPLRSKIAKICIPLWCALSGAGLHAQQKYNCLPIHDTTISFGDTIQLNWDTALCYRNFLFSAKKAAPSNHTIWSADNNGGFQPLFSDPYSRILPVVSANRDEMIYVRYRDPKPNAMRMKTLDSAWVCRSSVDGSHEQILFLIPTFTENAVYDLDWTTDNKKVLFSLGNDRYPTLTRDGDIFEYDIEKYSITNRTNDWEYWNNYGHYIAGSDKFAFSRSENPWFAYPANVYLEQGSIWKQAVTSEKGRSGADQFCVLTYASEHEILYRRGDALHNRLYAIQNGEENCLSTEAGYGGIMADDAFYAWLGTRNQIHLQFKSGQTMQIIVPGIEHFRGDIKYNVPAQLNAHLCWLGKTPAKVSWSNGSSETSLAVAPVRDTTYSIKVEVNGRSYLDSIRVFIRNQPPRVLNNGILLQTGKFLAYQWLQDGNPIEGATNPTFEPPYNGTFAVRVLDMKGRLLTSSPVPFQYPGDPSPKFELSIDASGNTIAVTANADISTELLDGSGKVVSRLSGAGVIDMGQLPDGEYKICVRDNHGRTLQNRVVVKKSN